MPLMMTFFNVRRGRDTLFKQAMRRLFPREARRMERDYGMRLVGWFNVTEGSEWDNVIVFDLPSYATLDKLYADQATRRLGHHAAEMIFERSHTIFLRTRMGPDLQFRP